MDVLCSINSFSATKKHVLHAFMHYRKDKECVWSTMAILAWNYREFLLAAPAAIQ
jgi:hypothetical protein